MGSLIEEQLHLDFSFGCPLIDAEYYREGAQDLILRLLPKELIDSSNSPHKTPLADLLPLIRWSDLSKAPCSLSVLLLCKYRLNGCNFFYDMICRWLLPQRKLNAELFFFSDVCLPHLSDDLLSVAELVVYLKSHKEVEEVRRNLHALETEIKIGITSDYHARRILEFKGLSAEGKTAMIQEKIGSLMQNHSKDFGQAIFSEMQQFLVSCREDFKTLRDYHHISRIISNLHLVRKMLKQSVELAPTKRHVILKCFKTHLSGPRKKAVLGILAGLNFLQEHECFEKEHLLKAILQKFENVSFVEGSSFIDPNQEGSIRTLYLEIEKQDETDFSLEEVQELRSALNANLATHIEQLTHPIFMPRNEEEVLRNIVNLSSQLRFVTDVPQTIISFEELKGQDLCFTVIFVRFRKEKELSVEEMLKEKKSLLGYIPDRIRTLGSTRGKYVKEATLFRTMLPDASFLRPDHSVDLYKAREYVLTQMKKAFGNLRDYNGGMILKQNEQLASLKTALNKTGRHSPLLIEKFFHTLTPIEVRTSLSIEPLKQLFLLLNEAMKNGETRLPFFGSDFLFKQEEKRSLTILPNLEKKKEIELMKKISSLEIPSHQYATFSLEAEGNSYTGFMLLSSEKALQEKFFSSFS